MNERSVIFNNTFYTDLCAVCVIIPGGALEEGASERGSWHFLEHLLFAKRGASPADDPRSAATEQGFWLTAQTTFDSMAIACVSQKDALPEMKIFLDRMVNGFAAAQQDFDLELEIILNELSLEKEEGGTAWFRPPDAPIVPSELDRLFESIAGSENSVSGLSLEGLRTLHARRCAEGHRILLECVNNRGDEEVEPWVEDIPRGINGRVTLEYADREANFRVNGCFRLLWAIERGCAAAEAFVYVQDLFAALDTIPSLEEELGVLSRVQPLVVRHKDHLIFGLALTRDGDDDLDPALKSVSRAFVRVAAMLERGLLDFALEQHYERMSPLECVFADASEIVRLGYNVGRLKRISNVRAGSLQIRLHAMCIALASCFAESDSPRAFEIDIDPSRPRERRKGEGVRAQRRNGTIVWPKGYLAEPSHLNGVLSLATVSIEEQWIRRIVERKQGGGEPSVQQAVLEFDVRRDFTVLSYSFIGKVTHLERRLERILRADPELWVARDIESARRILTDLVGRGESTSQSLLEVSKSLHLGAGGTVMFACGRKSTLQAPRLEQVSAIWSEISGTPCVRVLHDGNGQMELHTESAGDGSRLGTPAKPSESSAQGSRTLSGKFFLKQESAEAYRIYVVRDAPALSSPASRVFALAEEKLGGQNGLFIQDVRHARGIAYSANVFYEPSLRGGFLTFFMTCDARKIVRALEAMRDWSERIDAFALESEWLAKLELLRTRRESLARSRVSFAALEKALRALSGAGPSVSFEPEVGALRLYESASRATWIVAGPMSHDAFRGFEEFQLGELF